MSQCARPFTLLELLPPDIFSLMLANMMVSRDGSRADYEFVPYKRVALCASLSATCKTLQYAMREHSLEATTQHFLVQLRMLQTTYRLDYRSIIETEFGEYYPRDCHRMDVFILWSERAFRAFAREAVEKHSGIKVVKQLFVDQTLARHLEWLECEIGPNAYRFVAQNSKAWRKLHSHYMSRQALAKLWTTVVKAFKAIAAGSSTVGGLVEADRAVLEWRLRINCIYRNHSYNGEITYGDILGAWTAIQRRDECLALAAYDVVSV